LKQQFTSKFFLDVHLLNTTSHVLSPTIAPTMPDIRLYHYKIIKERMIPQPMTSLAPEHHAPTAVAEILPANNRTRAENRRISNAARFQ
jgi:hypothetical protein